jgi:hypothetical protein
VFRAVHAAFLEVVEVLHGLEVEVLAVHDEHHLGFTSGSLIIWLALKLVSVLPLPVVCQM